MRVIFTNIICVLMFFPSILFSSVRLSTLSNWNIDDFSEDTLLVAKTPENLPNGKAVFAFHVSRPHCFATKPIVMVRSAINAFSNGDIIIAEMKVDKDKPKLLKLKREFGFEDDGEDVNWYELIQFPSFSEGKRVKIIFKSRTPLNGFEVDITGIQSAKYQAEKICNSPVPIRHVSHMEKV
jgi:hypothetical protein